MVLEADRTAALTAACECLKPGGVIFKKNPAWIEDQEWVRSTMENGHRPDDAPRGGFRDRPHA